MDYSTDYQQIAQLLAVGDLADSSSWQQKGKLPLTADIDSLMGLLRELSFPMVYRCHSCPEEKLSDYYLSLIEQVSRILNRQVVLALLATSHHSVEDAEKQAAQLTLAMLKELPEIRRLLMSDVEAIEQNDPAVGSLLEVVSSYPSVTVMLHYRVAHALHQLGLPLLPRMITERAHSLTGIDIHPAARIGASFGIDHGTGIVIGATSVIGHHVMIYQGVTLGAKNFQHDEEGRLIDTPRHPIIEDHVTIYSNTSVLGRIRIGHDSVIGGNLWITHDVEPYSQVRQSKPVSHIGFTDGAGI